MMLSWWWFARFPAALCHFVVTQIKSGSRAVQIVTAAYSDFSFARESCASRAPRAALVRLETEKNERPDRPRFEQDNRLVHAREQVSGIPEG